MGFPPGGLPPGYGIGKPIGGSGSSGSGLVPGEFLPGEFLPGDGFLPGGLSPGGTFLPGGLVDGTITGSKSESCGGYFGGGFAGLSVGFPRTLWRTLLLGTFDW